MERSFAFAEHRTSRVTAAIGAEAGLAGQVAALSPDGVVLLYDAALGALADRIGTALDARAALPVEGGNDAKRLEVVGDVAARLHAAGTTRATVLVAIGGGTLTDLAGFVAAIYLRGLPFVSCPTTTLAMCDAALGGKNGVDHCGLKNRLGTIRQPDAIVMDVDWLATLPDEMFLEGIVEVVKKAAVLDAARFEELERLAPALLRRDPQATLRTVEMAVDMKMAVVLEDEREGDRRRALNAGHTIGHAIESLAGGDVRHGHAVAMGLVAECRAAAIDDAVTARVEALLRAIGAPTETPAPLRVPQRLWQLARHDKKAMRGSVPMYVPRRLGDGEVVELTEAGLERAMAR